MTPERRAWLESMSVELRAAGDHEGADYADAVLVLTDRDEDARAR